VFGAGGGTSSYREAEDADLLLMWGSNAREAHPIFFHHVLKGLRRGARMYAVDPRRTSTAQWADAWLGIDVGSDISLANAMGNEIIQAGLANEEFIRRATAGFDAYAAKVRSYPLERAERETGVPADLIRRVAHEYARAGRAQICWTLGITEHHNAADNVFALINLALLTGHVGRYGSGLVPLRGQNNVQGGGDMGAIPNKLTGFQDLETDLAARARFEAVYGAPIPPERGWHLSQMFEAMEEGELTACYIIGENPLRSEADAVRTRKLLSGLETLVVQDMFLTGTAEVADVVLPATATWCEAEGTVTNSERRVQRVRKALEPPPGVRDDIEIICDIARRLGTDWGSPTPEDLWNELRTLSPMHTGMSYRRLEELRGIQWPCYDEQHPGELFLHARLWEEDPAKRGAPAPFTPVDHDPPVDTLSAEFPLRLTTGRRLDSYNTGEQSGKYTTPIRRPETLNLSPEDMDRLGVAEGERVRISSRRGSVEAPVHRDEQLRAGLAFMTLHFPEQVETNVLTLDAWDPKSGTAEFKATAIRVDKLGVPRLDEAEISSAKAGN
jgi:predicted molibdopterin-dependent oxidoreductase YjgC